MKRITAIILIFCTLFCTFACGKSKKYYTHTWYGEYFDTPVVIGAYCTSQTQFDDVVSNTENLLSYWNDLLDIYNYHEGINGLYEINSAAGKNPVAVCDELYEFLEFCREMYGLTDAYTNVALGSVLSVWHDCREAASANPDFAQLPSDELLQFAAQHTDIGNLEFDKENKTVYISDASMTLDVGGIAKGYVTELLAKKLESLGFKSAVISLGGNVKVIGQKPSGAWSVGIQSPFDGGNTALTLEAVDGITVVTSGSYERYYTVNGVDYCHIIDKNTLYPARNFTSVSIIGYDSATADALSTALFCMTLDEGMALIGSLENTGAIWIDNDGNITYSAGLENLVKIK